MDDEIPEVIEFPGNQMEIEMKEAEFKNQDHSLVLPYDDFDHGQISKFINSSNVHEEDPEDQITLESQEFENKEDI